MSKLFVLSLFCVGLVQLSVGYKTGAPTEVCEDMTPQHKVPAQKTRSPYVVRLSKTKIHSGESVDVTITGKTGDLFKGFLIQARLGSTPLGTFTSKTNSPDVKFIDCGSGSHNAATHTSEKDKKEMVLTWTAPADLKNTVIFYTTVAKNGGEFWVAQKSRTLVVT